MMLEVGPGFYERFRSAQREGEERRLAIGKLPYWDKEIGWGHNFTGVGEDLWRDGYRNNYTEWDWYGSDAEQGLFYYYTRFIKKDVSILFGVNNVDGVEHWYCGNGDEVPTLLKYDETLLANYTDQCKKYVHGQLEPQRTKPQHHFYDHFGGESYSRRCFQARH